MSLPSLFLPIVIIVYNRNSSDAPLHVNRFIEVLL